MKQSLQTSGTVYIMTNINKTVLYTGVTSDLVKRILQHKNKSFPNSFTGKYNVTLLVYYKTFDTIEAAIKEEKRIKAGSRANKEVLINSTNPLWKDLWEEVVKW